MESLLSLQGVLGTLALIVIGYGAGRWAEKRHFQSIHQREAELQHLRVLSGEEECLTPNSHQAQLVMGSVVISHDYFKRFLAGFRILFGGPLGSYETLLERGRREAILRLKLQAQEAGADRIVNLRMETATIGNNANEKGGIGAIEVIAYGTAVKSEH